MRLCDACFPWSLFRLPEKTADEISSYLFELLHENRHKGQIRPLCDVCQYNNDNNISRSFFGEVIQKHRERERDRVCVRGFSLYSLALVVAAAVRWESVCPRRKKEINAIHFPRSIYSTIVFLLSESFHHWTDTNAQRQRKYYQTTISSDTSRIVWLYYIYIYI